MAPTTFATDPRFKTTSPSVMVGRQPILDRRRQVCGYELRFRSTDPFAAAELTGDEEAARNLTEAALSVKLDMLTHGRRAFIQLPLSFVQRDLAAVLPPDRVVVQIPCEPSANAEVLDACRRLSAAGYALALDRFTIAGHTPEVLALADFVKIDFLSTAHDDTAACLAASRNGRAISTIANRVDAREVFDEAVREGFTHAQGFFLEQPMEVHARTLPQGQVSSLQLLCALNDPNRSLSDLEDLVEHDATLCYRILRTVNSAGFGQSREITSMRHALLLLGRDTIRRWASLWVMAGIGASAHNELVLMASVRGRFCELLTAKDDESGGESFLLGMCSLLDVILRQPMAAIVQDLPLAPATGDALLGRHNRLRDLLDCVIAYDRADWKTCFSLMDAAHFSPAALSAAHAEAVRWAHDLTAP
jgi:EAL and modified HD-GYP domain-containing signal transduction protein